jgi:hypothetical protein
MINMGPWRCAAAEAATSALTSGLPGGIQPLRRHHDGWELVPPTHAVRWIFQKCDSDGGRFGALRRAWGIPAWGRARVRCRPVSRPTRFEEFRYLGDKRKQVVYDLDTDDAGATEAITELLASEQFAAFSPDTLAEARNRGYRPHASALPADAD